LLLLPLTAMHAADAYRERTSASRPETGEVIVREAQAYGSHYRHIVRNGVLYVEHVKEQTRKPIRRFIGQAVPVMSIRHAQPATYYSHLDGSGGPVDPASKRIGMQKTIPYTYDATIEQASVYIATMIHEGWSVEGRFASSDYADYYMRKNELRVRVIVLPHSLKLLYPIQGDVPDPIAALSEG